MEEVGQEEKSVYYAKAGLNPTWVQHYLDDIVLIKLSTVVNLPTISFPKSTWVIDSNHNRGVILGTGNTKESSLDMTYDPDIDLKYGEVVIQENSKTLYNYKKEKDTTLNERFLFASYYDTQSIGASGDSGGPTIIDNGHKKIQIGIIKDAYMNMSTVTGNTLLKVSRYSAWITNITGIQPESGTWNGNLIPTRYPTSIPSMTTP